MVLESWNGSRRLAAQFQGIPSWVLLVLPIPQKAAREVLEAWYFHQTWAEDGPRGLVFHQGGVGVVLGAWYYIRAVWG